MQEAAQKLLAEEIRAGNWSGASKGAGGKAAGGGGDDGIVRGNAGSAGDRKKDNETARARRSAMRAKCRPGCPTVIPALS